MKTTTIVLNGREHTIEELKARKNSAWLKKLEGPLAQILGLASQAYSTDLDDTQALLVVIEEATPILAGSIDTVMDLLIEYAPDLKDEIEEAYTSEVIESFIKVLGLVLPFEELMGRLKGLQSLGSSEEPTGTSSPAPSGDSGQTS